MLGITKYDSITSDGNKIVKRRKGVIVDVKENPHHMKADSDSKKVENTTPESGLIDGAYEFVGSWSIYLRNVISKTLTFIA